ncbi:hypothetical protein HK103_007351 [Boothiomyces macroporosus]|uniref:Uncharacterized protein n=1 Tax=Boothiomyces macroporosus TaxID=261099 RepID=A0AAD5UNG3_9FUNG|nr:hypothetical protein HK103_007351 [Boothiomyces macroporosus]
MEQPAKEITFDGKDTEENIQSDINVNWEESTSSIVKSVSFIVMDDQNDSYAEEFRIGEDSINSKVVEDLAPELGLNEQRSVTTVKNDIAKSQEEFKGKGILKHPESVESRKTPTKSATFTLDSHSKKDSNKNANKENTFILNKYNHVQSKLAAYIKGDCDLEDLNYKTNLVNSDENDRSNLTEVELTVASIVTVNNHLESQSSKNSRFNPNYIWAHRVIAPKTEKETFSRSRATSARSAGSGIGQSTQSGRFISTAKSRLSRNNSPFPDESTFSRPLSRCSEIKSMCTRDDIDSTDTHFPSFSQCSQMSQPINIEKLARRLFKGTSNDMAKELECRPSPTPWSEDGSNSEVVKVKEAKVKRKPTTRISSSKQPSRISSAIPSTRQSSAKITTRWERTKSAPSARIQSSMEKYSEQFSKSQKSPTKRAMTPIRTNDQVLTIGNNFTNKRPFSCPAYSARQNLICCHQRIYNTKSMSKYNFTERVPIQSCLKTDDKRPSETLKETLNSRGLLCRSIDELEFPEIDTENITFDRQYCAVGSKWNVERKKKHAKKLLKKFRICKKTFKKKFYRGMQLQK